MFVDTHCHIHEATLEGVGEENTKHKWIKAGSPKPEDIIERAKKAGVGKMICVGTTLADSELAVRFVADKDSCWASIGIHPHEAKDHSDKDIEKLESLISGQSSYLSAVQGDSEKQTDSYMPYGEGVSELVTKNSAKSGSRVSGSAGKQGVAVRKIVAVGEIGLDYYYEHSPKKIQREMFVKQLQIAKKHDLLVIFHVREAFDDFFAILADFEGLQGVVHSFTADTRILDKALNLGLYIGLNGIMTFTKDDYQLEAAKAVPLDRLLLETDSPFLTPKAHRGKICEPMHLVDTAEFLAKLRGEKLEALTEQTTKNAKELFKL
jgi:TatD DNase family protein